MHSPVGDAELTRTAFPHSEIPGSKVVCTSPRLIAADHVLHRLLAPRHPPYTLNSLTMETGIPRTRTCDGRVEVATQGCAPLEQREAVRADLRRPRPTIEFRDSLEITQFH